jgi:hypothetical protein
MPTTSQMLLQWDRQRARSQQLELGWSEVGGCRRRAGYRLAHTLPDNEGGSVQAVLGTAVDEATNAVAVQLGLTAQQEVTYLGILGHFDRIEPVEWPDGRTTEEVIDVKTVGTDRWLEHYEIHGIPEQHQMQVHGYAAGLILAGHNISHVRVDYLARDTGREWAWRSRYDPLTVKKAVEWLRLVRDTELGMLPRDYEPDSMFCQHCPFLNTCWGGHVPNRDPRSVIFNGDPDIVKYAQQLRNVRKEIDELKARAVRLAGILDAVRPDDPSPGEKRTLVQAGDNLLDFRPTKNGYAIYFRGRSAITKGTTS